MQSGGLFNPFWLWQTREDAVGLSSVLATLYNCTDLSPQGKLDCLQNIDAKDLEESINLGSEETLGIQKVFRGTGIIDGDFFPDIPTELVDRGEYNHVDLMLGMTKDEGLLQTIQFEINHDLYGLAQVLYIMRGGELSHSGVATRIRSTPSKVTWSPFTARCAKHNRGGISYC